MRRNSTLQCHMCREIIRLLKQKRTVQPCCDCVPERFCVRILFKHFFLSIVTASPVEDFVQEKCLNIVF